MSHAETKPKRKPKGESALAPANGYDNWSQHLMLIIHFCGWPRRATAGKLELWHKYRDKGMTPQEAYRAEFSKMKLS